MIYYNYLVKTGKIEDFRKKHPSQMTPQEKELLNFDQGKSEVEPLEKELGGGQSKGFTKEMLGTTMGMLAGMKSKLR